jgi:nucleoside-diphosphate-sugar epimerase
MRVLVTGSAGHLGEALVRTLKDGEHEVVGIQYAAYAIVEEAKTSGRDTAGVTIVSIANSESGEILGTCPR